MRAALVCLAAAGCQQLFGLAEPVVRDGGGSASDTRSDVPVTHDTLGGDALGGDAPASTIALRQFHAASGAGNSFSVNYSGQLAGDLNVVVIGWTSNTTLNTLTDASGNLYALAVRTTSGSITESIYYCCNIVAAQTNQVTATFSGQTTFDLRAAEYSGVRANTCFDRYVDSSGTATSLTSSAMTTSASPELLVGADTTSQQTVNGDPAFTTRAIDGHGNLYEDRVVTATGNYTATATQNATGTWVMQMVAFVGQ